MKNLTLLVGLPACGKTTWRANHPNAGIPLSTDDIIEHIAASAGKTYDEVFVGSVGDATELFETFFKVNLHEGKDIVIDRTNLTPKTRRRFIDSARCAGYHIHAVVFERPMTSAAHDEWNRRLERPGKTIPVSVLQTMFCSFEYPLFEEGLTMITPINTFHIP